MIIDRDLFQVPSQVVRALAAQDSPKAKAKKNKKKKKKKKEKKRQKEEQRQREEAERVGGRLRTKRDRRNNATSDRDPRGVRRGKSSSSIHSNRAQNGLGNDHYHDHNHDHDGDALETMRALKRKVSRSRSTADLARSRSRKYKQNDDNDSSSSDSSDSDSDSSSDGSGDSGGDGGGNGDGNGNGDAFIVPSLGGINSAVSNFFGSLTKDATTSALSPPSSFVASDHPLNRLHSSKDTSRRKQRGGGKRNSTNTHRSSRSKRGARSKPPPPSALALSSRSASAATSSTAVEAAAALMAPGTLISTIFNTSSKPDPQHHTGDGGVGRGLTRSASAYLGFEDNSTAPSPMSSAPTSPMLSVNTSAAPVRGFESITPSTRHPRPSQSHTPYLRPDYMQDVEAGVGSLVFDDDALKNIQVGGGSSRDKDRQRGRDRDRDRERERERKTTRRSSRTERSKKLSKRRSSTRRSKRSGGSSNDTDTVSASMSSRGGTPKVVMSPEQVPSSLVSSSVAQAASLIRRNDSTGTGQHATRSGERTTNHTRKANVHSSNRTRVNKSKGGVGGGSRRADANKRIFEHDVVPTPSK